MEIQLKTGNGNSVKNRKQKFGLKKETEIWSKTGNGNSVKFLPPEFFLW
jgi:hypothetical protein